MDNLKLISEYFSDDDFTRVSKVFIAGNVYKVVFSEGTHTFFKFYSKQEDAEIAAEDWVMYQNE